MQIRRNTLETGAGPADWFTRGPGDRVFFEPSENHWHGAAPTRFMTHVAIQQADERGSVVDWGKRLGDAQAPSLEDGGR